MCSVAWCNCFNTKANGHNWNVLVKEKLIWNVCVCINVLNGISNFTVWYKVFPCHVGCSGVSIIGFLPFSQKLPIAPALHWLLQGALSNDSSNSPHSSTHTKNIPFILTPSTHNQLQMAPGKTLVLCVHQHELNLPPGDLGISRTWCICPSLMGVFVLTQALELAAYCFPADLSRHWIPTSRLW